LRGCGQSTKFCDSSKYSLSIVAEDIAALIEKLQLNDVSILGFSFGGRVLMEFLSKNPSKIRSAILASTTAYADYQEELNSWEEYNTRNNTQIKERVNLLFSDKNITYQEKSEKLAILTSGLDIWDLTKAETLKLIFPPKN
jgi:pimeloyl-ACP methyl ester carboxylesterase